ncbi:uncharacterized protein LOC116120324 [Pistacia vera]|uniref:uncharacterized protein LOC116120324 n=1 Tax=Pistacia vera TaxID=55513 RepID=UPI0012637EA6|nr:uncharacterized protein LOC116120324 [Pistacia vera]XP_031262150.1 uncharacterized protein LOC116120324 [Pistacia vera]XP_031262155.1 uncharacterized protein LOC116120324 [Pistacia vera]
MTTSYRAALDEEWDKLKNVYDDEGAFAFTFPQTAAYDTPFHLAVFSQSEEPLQSFLDKAKADPMAKPKYLATNIYGNTALHEAAANGNIEAVRILVKHDKEIREDRNREGETQPLLEVINNEGETPLFKAAAYGQTEVVSYLAGESCTNGQLKDIHRMKKKPETSILHAAIQGENFETALFLLKEVDESLATAVDGNGMTSLELLATMPSAFRSGYRMSIWGSILYLCPLIDAKRRIGFPILGRI